MVLVSMLVCHSAFSQTNKFSNKDIEKWLIQADKYIPEFHRDSVICVYPIYYLLAKKECRKTKFDRIPTYNQIDSCMDFKHIELDKILVKTTNGIWSLDGFDYLKKIYCYNRNSDRIVTLFNYLDSAKADKAYYLFGMFYLTLIEKDGERTMIKEMENTWQECKIPDLVDLEDWNIWLFPTNEERLPPVIGY